MVFAQAPADFIIVYHTLVILSRNLHFATKYFRTVLVILQPPNTFYCALTYTSDIV